MLSNTKDAEEVVNYVGAMNYGLERLETLPLSLRLLREIHERLMRDVRGSERSPGEFRTTQNWIGAQGCTLNTASFVPPPPHEMTQALDNLEKFLHEAGTLPVLIQCGLAHAQFETIHPFLDGNGRVGRLLITLLLCAGGVLERPLLYLSVYLKAHRAEYYDRLTAIRSKGDWEGWLRFFLRGVAEVSLSATNTAKAILQLRERTRHQLDNSAQGPRLLDHLFERPLISIRAAQAFLNCSYGTAASLIEQMEALGILKETTGQKRNKLYRYEPYLAIFEQQGLSTASSASTPTDEQAT
ncbi:Fic family protein [Corallococcus sp. AB049A]|uniref:Fic family protein n=1 Tax=Corallococcus sp. AB049A TaxID=2316721 RepID=UPI001F3604A4|nr:Fic family protein [Corallococcus sp. AB049A]